MTAHFGVAAPPADRLTPEAFLLSLVTGGTIALLQHVVLAELGGICSIIISHYSSKPSPSSVDAIRIMN